MSTLRTASTAALLLSASIGLAACSGMSPRDRDTATGAAIGGVAGNVLTGGGAIGTVGGAAVGGVIGNQIGKKKDKDNR
jgi:osmotically inducible lipoprotein OsmB